MLHSIVRFSLKFRFLVIALAVGVVAFGVLRLRSMPVDVLPEFSLPSVEIQTESLGRIVPVKDIGVEDSVHPFRDPHVFR